MGPEAAVEFLRRLIAFTPVQADQDHIPTVLVNDPRIPDRTANLEGRGESPLPQLIAAAKLLEQAGCDLIVIPCNTAHSWLRELRTQVAVPFLDIIECTVEEAQDTVPGAKVAVMASDGTLASGLYQNALAERNLEHLLPAPELQKRIVDILYAVKKDGATVPLRERLESVIEELAQQGAGVIIAGCTELPLVLPESTPVPVADSISAPARRIVRMLMQKGLLV
jgi:aspartate racemase